MNQASLDFNEFLIKFPQSIHCKKNYTTKFFKKLETFNSLTNNTQLQKMQNIQKIQPFLSEVIRYDYF